MRSRSLQPPAHLLGCLGCRQAELARRDQSAAWLVWIVSVAYLLRLARSAWQWPGDEHAAYAGVRPARGGPVRVLRAAALLAKLEAAGR